MRQVVKGLGYTSTIADPNEYWQEAAKANGDCYCELILVVFYVDDILCNSENPEATLSAIAKIFELGDTILKESDRYLGANLQKWVLPSNGWTVWAMMDGKDYVRNSVGIVRDLLYSDGKHLRTGSKVAERPIAKELQTRA